MRSNYFDLGLSISMGKLLRKEVESQLLVDLSEYGIEDNGLFFDWSESCIEGYCVKYLDGSVDRFSGIKLFDTNDNLIVDGWMDFIFEEFNSIFIVYWHFLSIYQNGIRIERKETKDIPPHVIKKLPDKLKSKYIAE